MDEKSRILSRTTVARVYRFVDGREAVKFGDINSNFPELSTSETSGIRADLLEKDFFKLNRNGVTCTTTDKLDGL